MEFWLWITIIRLQLKFIFETIYLLYILRAGIVSEQTFGAIALSAIYYSK